jgi:Uma2 family endonuclease
MTVQVLRRRFTVDEYYRMAEAGILHEDDRIELIEGEIVEMAPIGSNHASYVDRLAQLFFGLISGRAIIRVQSPIHLGEYSELQPDVTLLRARPDFYASAHPGPADILLLIEVADTSAAYDREVKAPLYARADIQEYWIVDLAEKSVEVYREPNPEGFRLIRLLRQGDRITPEAFPDVEIAIDDVLLSSN